MLHVGSSSLTREPTQAPRIGSTVLVTGPLGKSLHLFILKHVSISAHIFFEASSFYFQCRVTFSVFQDRAYQVGASKVMFKILQTKLPQYQNSKLSDVQAGFRKGRGTRDQIANIWWIIEEAREFQKNIYFCFLDYANTFDCVDHNKLWKILKEMGILDHLICFLGNLYAGQEATVRTVHGTIDWFQIRKGIYIVTLLI